MKSKNIQKYKINATEYSIHQLERLQQLIESAAANNEFITI